MNPIETEIKETKPDGLAVNAKNLRTFGVGGAAIFAGIWVLRLFVFHHGNAWPLLVLAAYLLVAGLFFHPALTPVFRVWGWIAHKIGWFNTRLLLGVIYYLIFTPMGIIARLLGKDAMSRKLEPERTSYWLPVTKKHELTDYEKEF
jgi:hypothetical protein